MNYILLCVLLLINNFWNINAQQPLPLSVFGFSQSVHYSKLYHSVLWSNASLTEMNLMTFVPGCHNDCPKFLSVYDPYGQITYLKITFGESRDTVGAYSIKANTDITTVDLPDNATAFWFYGNGTAYYLRDNSTVLSNDYTIYNWNTTTNKIVLVKSVSGSAYRFFRACLTQTTLYALDREKALLIIWPYTSSITTIPLNKNNVWVNSIESMSWSNEDEALYALDRNGTVYSISISNGNCDVKIAPQWPSVTSLIAKSQLIIDQNSGDMYYLGFDKIINAYRLIISTKHDITSTPIQNGVYGLQWVCLTQFTSPK